MLKKIAIHSLLLSSFLMVEANAVTHGRAWSSANQGRFAASIQGGIMPMVYTSRSIPNASGAIGVKPPNFSDQFKLPYDLLGELGYMVVNNVEVFYNFDWSHAAGKTYSFVNQGINFSQRFSNYNAYGNYLGARYYFTFRSVPVMPFVGLKIGLLSQNGITANQLASLGGASQASTYTYFKKQNSLAGGLQLGVDWQLLKNLSLTLKAEVLASQKRNGNIILNSPAYRAGNTGTQLLIPVTLGVKFVM